MCQPSWLSRVCGLQKPRRGHFRGRKGLRVGDQNANKTKRKPTVAARNQSLRITRSRLGTRRQRNSDLLIFSLAMIGHKYPPHQVTRNLAFGGSWFKTFAFQRDPRASGSMEIGSRVSCLVDNEGSQEGPQIDLKCRLIFEANPGVVLSCNTVPYTRIPPPPNIKPLATG